MPIREIQDKLTPLPEREFILEAAKAWKSFYGKGPEVKQLACCLAQMVLEIGRQKHPDKTYTWGKFCHNFNMGNIKSREGDGSDWQYYGCGEEVSLERAQQLIAESPELVSIKKQYTWSNGAKRASIWCAAPHPWSRFRAYDTAEAGLLDYIDFLVGERTRYLTAWNEGVMKGDPVTFSMELSKAGYYTADPARYTKTVVALFREFEDKVKEVLSSPQGQALYEDQQARDTAAIMALVGRTAQMSLDDMLGGATVESLEPDAASECQSPNVPSA